MTAELVVEWALAAMIAASAVLIVGFVAALLVGMGHALYRSIRYDC